MRVAAAIYVDNQGVVGYPVEYLVRKMTPFDKIYVFGSDDENIRILEGQLSKIQGYRDRVQLVEIGKKVLIPGDIAIAQNSCIEWLLANDPSDFFVIVQADILLTDMAFRFLGKWFCQRNLAESVHLTIRHLRLYLQAHQTYFGVTAMGRRSPKRFVGDGAYVEGSPYWNHDWDCLDIGYFSTTQYYRHALNHVNIWKTHAVHYQTLVDLYQNDRRNFIRKALEYVREHERPEADLVPIDMMAQPYRDVIEFFKLEADYAEVSSVLLEMKEFYQKWGG